MNLKTNTFTGINKCVTRVCRLVALSVYTCVCVCVLCWKCTMYVVHLPLARKFGLQRALLSLSLIISLTFPHSLIHSFVRSFVHSIYTWIVQLRLVRVAFVLGCYFGADLAEIQLVEIENAKSEMDVNL